MVMSDLKMSDSIGSNTDFWGRCVYERNIDDLDLMEVTPIVTANNAVTARLVSHAINNHDSQAERIKELEEALKAMTYEYAYVCDYLPDVPKSYKVAANKCSAYSKLDLINEMKELLKG